MTLDEAIAKARADGDVQLAEWLRQARGADAAARWYTEKLRDTYRTIRKLLNENSKLRKLARDIHTLATDHGVDVRYPYCDAWEEKLAVVEKQMRELGIEV